MSGFPSTLDARARKTWFATPANSVISLLILSVLAWVAIAFVRWGILNATVTPVVETCKRATGACWGVVVEKYRLLLIGRYPMGEGWRCVVASAVLIGGIALAALPRFFNRWGLMLLLGVVLIYLALMRGGLLGLSKVDTDLWGGLPLTVLLSLVSCLGAVPLGIALALARRSKVALLRWVATAYIEGIRGIPLISVLFFGSFVLPLLLPQSWRTDLLTRVGVCLVFFLAAYLAEVFRGGLQAISKGQGEAAQALSLSGWQTLRHVTLPQALRITLPPMFTHFIGAVKDTSLVAIVSLYDLTGSLKMAVSDAVWYPFAPEMYLVVCIIYLAIGYSISRYGRFLEARYALVT